MSNCTLPDEATGMELYRVAVDEYRFQVRLSASRTTQLLLLSAAVIAAAAATLRFGSRPVEVVTGALLLLGAIASVTSALVSSTQHRQYRRVCDRMRAIEDELGIEHPLRLTTTYTMGGERRPGDIIAVRRLLELVLLFIAAADVSAGIYLIGFA